MEQVSFQLLFNVVATACGCLVGWILKTIWQAVRDLRESDEKLIDKVNRVEVVVAGKYVTRDELDRQYDAINSKLDRIFDRLEKKADKQ